MSKSSKSSASFLSSSNDFLLFFLCIFVFLSSIFLFVSISIFSLFESFIEVSISLDVVLSLSSSFVVSIEAFSNSFWFELLVTTIISGLSKDWIISFFSLLLSSTFNVCCVVSFSSVFISSFFISTSTCSFLGSIVSSTFLFSTFSSI